MFHYLLLSCLSIVFFELFLWLRMSRDAAQIVTCSSDSAHILISAEMGDDEKEAVIRRRSMEIFKATRRLAGKLLLTCLILYLLFQMLTLDHPDFRKVSLSSLFSPVAIAAVTVAIVCYTWLRKTVLARL